MARRNTDDLPASWSPPPVTVTATATATATASVREDPSKLSHLVARLVSKFFSTMSSSAAPRSATGEAPKRKISLVRNAMKNKHNFIQFFAMTGILLLSFRSLGQKYRMHDLLEDNAALKDEQKSLHERINHIKSGLFHEASLDSTGIFSSRLKALFGDNQ